jgi:dihydroneopterin aldolase
VDKVLLHGLQFYGFHGVEPAEKAFGQPIYVDVELSLDLKSAGQADDLRLTVNYAEVFEAVRKTVEEEQFSLLEALAEAIARRLLEGFAVKKVRVRVKKPKAPVKAAFDFFGVEIERRRS